MRAAGDAYYCWVGIRSTEEINEAKNAGANVIVIGNYTEDNVDFLLDIAQFWTSQLH